MLPRVLEPEVMDTADDAADYDAMDHAQVNRRFVDDLLTAVEHHGKNAELLIRGTWLDVGTGTALIPIELCRCNPGIRVLGIDLAEEMLTLGRRNVETARLSDAITLSRVDAKDCCHFGEGDFTAVISNTIVHHIPEPVHVWREMLRVLHPGGLLFVRDLLRPETEAEVEHLVATHAGQEPPQSQQLLRQSLHAALTLDEVRSMLDPLGIEADSVQQTSDRHWTVSAMRRG
ncbi:MAG: class I SAM-dependent methyltransferase [Planctomycetaceae bacterium]